MPATARQTEGPGPWSYWWVPGRAPRFQNAAHITAESQSYWEAPGVPSCTPSVFYDACILEAGCPSCVAPLGLATVALQSLPFQSSSWYAG